MSEGFDPQALLAQALDMQQRLMDAQAEAAAEVLQGSSGGGKVVVTMTGAGEVVSVRIDPSVVVVDEVDLLEDLIVAAIRDAATKVSERAQQGLGGLGDLLGEGGLEGALGGLFGAGPVESGPAESGTIDAKSEPSAERRLPPGEK